MSDDGYAADSPFDGLDDYYIWDDAASQDVADDLAEHTMPSPVYLEDPAYEMMGGYSDWEYYSDDYYDDDPNLLNNNPQGGSPPAALKFPNVQTNSHAAQKRGRKRKLADTEDIPNLSLSAPGLAEIVQNIGHNIVGTTWKTEKSDSEKLYQRGEAKRVALLKDWRNVFRESQPKSDRRPKGTLKNMAALEDEWANDLGLADMGLTAATGNHISANEIGNNYDDDEHEESDSEQKRPFQDGVVPLGEEVDGPTGIPEDGDEAFYALEPTKVKAQSLDQILPSRKRKKITGGDAGADILDTENESDIELQLAERIFSASKKKKTSSVSSASARSIRNSNATTSVGNPELQTNGTQKRGRGRPKKQNIKLAEDQSMSPGNAKNATTNAAAASVASKKRKATTEASAENNDGATVTTASSRAKRVASDKSGLRNDDGSELMTQLPKPTSRGVRQRKK
jgi:hypothetical protein